MILFFLKRIIGLVFLVYSLMIIARLLGSWFPQFADHPAMRFLGHYTDPYLNIFKRFIPPLGMIDLSPIAALFSLQIAQWLLLLIL